MKKPRWYYSLKGHCEKNGCGFEKVQSGWEIDCPNESSKEDVGAYAQKLGVTPRCMGDYKWFIADSVNPESFISTEDIYNLLENGEIYIAVPETMSATELGEKCVEYIEDIWGEPAVNVIYPKAVFNFADFGGEIHITASPVNDSVESESESVKQRFNVAETLEPLAETDSEYGDGSFGADTSAAITEFDMIPKDQVEAIEEKIPLEVFEDLLDNGAAKVRGKYSAEFTENVAAYCNAVLALSKVYGLDERLQVEAHPSKVAIELNLL